LQGSTTIGQCDHKRHSLLQHAVTIDELLLRIIVNLVFWRRNPLGLQQRWRPAAWPITTLCDMQRQQIFARRFEKMARWSSVRLEGQHRRTKKEYLSSMIHVRVRYESRTPADKRGTEARPDDFTISKAFFLSIPSLNNCFLLLSVSRSVSTSSLVYTAAISIYLRLSPLPSGHRPCCQFTDSHVQNSQLSSS
jgi:hypothetical protein